MDNAANGPRSAPSAETGAAERSTGAAAVAGANCAAAYLAMACFAVEGGSFDKVDVASWSMFLFTFLMVHVAFI